jgi:hypothetical protein
LCISLIQDHFQGRKGKRANAYATAMAGTLGGMLKSGREYLKDPKNNFASLDRDCTSVKDQNAELLKDLIPIPERMVDLCGDLQVGVFSFVKYLCSNSNTKQKQEDSVKLMRALEDNDERRANISHTDVNRHLQVLICFDLFWKKKNNNENFWKGIDWGHWEDFCWWRQGGVLFCFLWRKTISILFLIFFPPT